MITSVMSSFYQLEFANIPKEPPRQNGICSKWWVLGRPIGKRIESSLFPKQEIKRTGTL